MLHLKDSYNCWQSRPFATKRTAFLTYTYITNNGTRLLTKISPF